MTDDRRRHTCVPGEPDAEGEVPGARERAREPAAEHFRRMNDRRPRPGRDDISQ
jgi:hypothetical protein